MAHGQIESYGGLERCELLYVPPQGWCVFRSSSAASSRLGIDGEIHASLLLFSASTLCDMKCHLLVAFNHGIATGMHGHFECGAFMLSDIKPEMVSKKQVAKLHWTIQVVSLFAYSLQPKIFRPLSVHLSLTLVSEASGVTFVRGPCAPSNICIWSMTCVIQLATYRNILIASYSRTFAKLQGARPIEQLPCLFHCGLSIQGQHNRLLLHMSSIALSLYSHCNSVWIEIYFRDVLN